MGTVIPQTVYESLEPGTYRARLGAAVVEDGDFGQQVAMRWDLLDEGFEDRFLRAWASAKLSGGKRPSKLYTWTSVLLFGGKPLPEGYDLDLDTLLDREALLVVETVQKDGIDRNRVTQLLPLRQAKAAAPAPRPAPAPAPAPEPEPVRAPVKVVKAKVPAAKTDPASATGPVLIEGMDDKEASDWLDATGTEVNELPF